jgi:hypothetical protein
VRWCLHTHVPAAKSAAFLRWQTPFENPLAGELSYDAEASRGFAPAHVVGDSMWADRPAWCGGFRGRRVAAGTLGRGNFSEATSPRPGRLTTVNVDVSSGTISRARRGGVEYLFDYKSHCMCMEHLFKGYGSIHSEMT